MSLMQKLDRFKEETRDRGFPGLRCPMCGCTQVGIPDLSAVGQFRCEDDCCFNVEELLVVLERWRGVLDWVKQAPTLPSPFGKEE